MKVGLYFHCHSSFCHSERISVILNEVKNLVQVILNEVKNLVQNAFSVILNEVKNLVQNAFSVILFSMTCASIL